MSISKKSQADDQRRSCSRKMRQEGSPPTSRSCQSYYRNLRPSYPQRITRQNTASIKSGDDYRDGCPPNNEPHHFLIKAAVTLFERFFVNPLTALVFDPSVVTSIPLVLDHLAHAFEVIGFGSNCPNCHVKCNPHGGLIQIPGSHSARPPGRSWRRVVIAEDCQLRV